MRRFVLVACLATLAPPPSSAQEPSPSDRPAAIELADYVPEGLVVFVDVPDMDHVAKLVHASPWSRLFGDPRVVAFLRPLVDETIDAQGDLAKVLGTGLADVGKLLAGRSQFAAREVRSRRGILTQFAWLHALGPRTQHAEKLIGTYGESEGGLEEVQIGEHVGYRLPVAEELASRFGPSMLLIVFRGHLLLSSSLRWAAPMVEAKPLEKDSFHQSPAFARVPKSGPIRALFDPARSHKLEKARYGAETAATRLAALIAIGGPARALPLTARVNLEGGEFVERYRGVVVEETPESVRDALRKTPRGFTLLGRVSADAAFVFATRTSVPESIRAFAAYVDTQTHYGDFEMWFGEDVDAADIVDQAVEVSREAKLDERFFSALGTEIVLTLTPPGSGFVPTPLLRIAVTDRAKLAAFLDGPAAEALGEHGTVKKSGGGLYVIRFTGAPTAIVLGLGDDQLVAGITAGAVREGLRAPGRAIVDHGSFTSAMSAVGAADLATASTIGYADTPQWVGFGYEALIPLIDMFAADVKLDPGAAPGRERVAGHFTPSAFSVRYTDQGCEADVRGVMAPISLGATLFTAPFLVADWLGRRTKDQ